MKRSPALCRVGVERPCNAQSALNRLVVLFKLRAEQARYSFIDELVFVRVCVVKLCVSCIRRRLQPARILNQASDDVIYSIPTFTRDVYSAVKADNIRYNEVADIRTARTYLYVLNDATAHPCEHCHMPRPDGQKPDSNGNLLCTAM